MPLGWYHAQGLYPLGPSSSDDEEGPCELPDGRVVCGPHGFVVCGKCCSDYSFMDDILNEERDEERERQNDARGEPLTEPEKKRGTGRVIPTIFALSSTGVPIEWFLNQRATGGQDRYIHKDDRNMLLLFTDGACLDNGRSYPRAGWAVVTGTEGPGGEPIAISGRLENEGPFGDVSVQSSNRAELRAVIAALRVRRWAADGFTTLVIASDSEYVIKGATEWVRTWLQNGWRTAQGTDVKNKDLWELLLGEFERCDDEGLAIKFWKIAREFNVNADTEAKEAAEKEEVPDKWADVLR